MFAPRMVRLTFNVALVKPEALMAAVECSSCHRLVSFSDYLSEFPLLMDEICAECEKTSPERCAACRLAWMRGNPAFSYRCRECVQVAVPC